MNERGEATYEELKDQSEEAEKELSSLGYYKKGERWPKRKE